MIPIWNSVDCSFGVHSVMANGEPTPGYVWPSASSGPANCILPDQGFVPIRVLTRSIFDFSCAEIWEEKTMINSKNTFLIKFISRM